MNYYTANLMFEDSEETAKVINSIVNENDTLYIVASDDSIAKALSKVYKNKLKCKVLCDGYFGDAIDERAFDIETKVFCGYIPALIDLTNMKIADFELQICGMPYTTLYRHPNIFNVSWSIWKKPVTLEQLLAERFGYHSNPYTGYVEYIRDYTNAYNKFIEDFDKEHWANV